MSTLPEPFIEELKDISDAEHQIFRAWPRMIKAARHEELKEALQSHWEETGVQMARLSQHQE